MNMILVDAPDAVDKWRERYKRTHEAFQEKHVYVTRLEIRADELEKQIKASEAKAKQMVKDIESQSRAVTALSKRLDTIERYPVSRDKEKAEKSAPVSVAVVLENNA